MDAALVTAVCASLASLVALTGVAIQERRWRSIYKRISDLQHTINNVRTR
jgi:hypothetical protein